VIRQRGFRVTLQRQLILEAVRAGKGHSTPEQVYHRVSKKAPALNRATVYRTLDFLAAQHLITSTDVGTGGKVYEIAEEKPHHHLVCEQCGKIEQVGHGILERAFKQVESEHGFKVTSNHVALFGVCQECQRRRV
jgi:Fur family ferric uptake transcriptional regulator